MTSDRYLLIPGTSGCKLLDNGVDVGWPAELTLTSWLSVSILAEVVAALGIDPERIVELLSMEFGDPGSVFPTKTTLKAGSSVTPGPVISAAYNQFQDYATFPYDWRADIRGSGKKLLRFLKDHQPTGGKWRIVAHSQGGLVAIVASRLAALEAGGADDAFSTLVRRMALLATPLHGTVNAADALINGDNLGGGFRAHFKRMARTWPALYQMLPTWRGSVRTSTGQIVEKSAMNPDLWPASLADRALLVRARETRKEYFVDPLACTRGVEVRIAMSAAHPTCSHIVQTADGFLVPEPDEAGDTLVPEVTTRGAMSEIERECSHSFGDQRDTMVHFLLATDPVLATEVRSFLAR